MGAHTPPAIEFTQDNLKRLHERITSELTSGPIDRDRDPKKTALHPPRGDCGSREYWDAVKERYVMYHKVPLMHKYRKVVRKTSPSSEPRGGGASHGAALVRAGSSGDDLLGSGASPSCPGEASPGPWSGGSPRAEALPLGDLWGEASCVSGSEIAKTLELDV